MLRDSVQVFAAERIAPLAGRIDREDSFPRALWPEMGALGLHGITVEEEYGGAGLGYLEHVIAMEEISRASGSVGLSYGAHSNLCVNQIRRNGNDAQKRRYLPKLISGEHVGALAMSEPAAGSDVVSMTARAEKKGDRYILNGAKAFVSGGGRSDFYLVMCRTGVEGPKGISTLAVPKDTPGLSFGAQERKLGWNSQPTAMVLFDNAEVSAENLVGGEGEGFRIAMMGLDGGRVNIAACSLGGARASLEAALAYVRDRKQFGRALAEFQALQFRLAGMATELEAARLMVHRAATKLDREAPDRLQACAMAKRFATDRCFEIANQALQLHGGYGYLKDFPIERYLRDLRVHQILEGTNEIMQVIVARQLLKGAG
ncbi:MAG: acyl-CoA dehydrogenase family protein [Rhodospirillales bacterium]|nr:acyl-CoA dehydrogenase family protein [Rhodospirillales bacterium]